MHRHTDLHAETLSYLVHTHTCSLSNTMETSDNVAAPLNTKISLFSSFSNMKKQESFRCHMLSACLAMVQMVHVLHSLWDAILPFALLWWNVMLCATCARYYSWNRSRFHLQIVGQQFHGVAVTAEVDEEEIGEKNGLPGFNEAATHMGVITNYASGSRMQASFERIVEVEGCCPLLSAENCDVHQDDMESCEPLVENVVTCAERQGDHRLKEFSSCEAPFVLNTQVSTAASASPACRLSPLHFFDIRKTQDLGLLKPAYWEVCPFLLPQKVAPLAGYSQELFERLWMQSSINRNSWEMKILMHLLYTVFMNCSSIEECLQVMNTALASRFWWWIQDKEFRCLTRKLLKFQGCIAFNGTQNALLATLFSLDNAIDMRGIMASKSLEGDAKNLGLGTAEHSSMPDLLGSKLMTMSGYPYYEDQDEDASEDIECSYGTSHQICSNFLESSSHVSLDSVPDREGGGAVSGYLQCKDILIDSGEDIRGLHEMSIQLDENYFDVHGASVDSDVRYNGMHWLQDVDSVYAGYYSAPDRVLTDGTDVGGINVDLAVSKHARFDDVGEIEESSEVKPRRCLDTWWDADAVLVDNQEREEDGEEHAWQMV